MEGAEDADVTRACLCLGREAVLELGRFGEGDELDLAREVREDLVPDLLLLFDRAELAREHRHRAARRRGRAG
jgi:hypothetical protein